MVKNIVNGSNVLKCIAGDLSIVLKGREGKDLKLEFGLFNTGVFGIDGTATTFNGQQIASSGYPFTTMHTVAILYFTYSMGSVFKFHTAGKIYAVGAQCRWGGKISVFEDGVDEALQTADVAGDSSTALTIRIKYTTLDPPLDVAADSTYRIIFKGLAKPSPWTGPRGGYSYFTHASNVPVNADNNWQGDPNPITGNISWLGGSHVRATDAASPEPEITTVIGSIGYGTTDIIFGPT
jgi:hypothetical protein